MSDVLKNIFKWCPYKEPSETQFYSMLRRGCNYEIEKQGRNGYTIDLKDAGVFNRDNAFNNVKHIESNGCLRFNIEKDLLDSIVSKLEKLQEENKRLKELLNSVNDHAESCSIFIFDDEHCNCFYKEIQKAKEVMGE